MLFGGAPHSLIPLYAVGAFLSFTLSQSGMVIHWWRLRGQGWKRNIAAVNAVGAAATFLVLLVITVTKFLRGAWMVILLLPLVGMALLAIHCHYQALGRQRRVTSDCPSAPQRPVRHSIAPDFTAIQ